MDFIHSQRIKLRIKSSMIFELTLLIIVTLMPVLTGFACSYDVIIYYKNNGNDKQDNTNIIKICGQAPPN